MKQEYVRLRSTEEQEEIDGEHSECVHEDCSNGSRLNVRASHRRACGFNKQGACLSHEDDKFVI